MQEAESPSVEAPKNLYAKLAEVMSEIGYVEKRGYNDFHKYRYVTEADLVDAVREKLAARNVMVIPSLTGIDERAVTNAKGKASTITTAKVAFTFCDGDTGQTHVAEWAGAGDDPADKGLYKAYTGAVKYFLMKSFLIPTGDDPEADAGTDECSSGGQASAPPPPEPKISDDDARKLYDEAQAAHVPDDKLALAISHATQGRGSTLADLTGPQAVKVGVWIDKKRTEAEREDLPA